MSPRKLVAGNWKMNVPTAAAAMLDALPTPEDCDVLIFPPATLLARLAGGRFPMGGQDCHPEPAGAHTGDVSAEMLADAGATAVIQPGGSIRDEEVRAIANSAGLAMIFTGRRHFLH